MLIRPDVEPGSKVQIEGTIMWLVFNFYKMQDLLGQLANSMAHTLQMEFLKNNRGSNIKYLIQELFLDSIKFPPHLQK